MVPTCSVGGTSTDAGPMTATGLPGPRCCGHLWFLLKGSQMTFEPLLPPCDQLMQLHQYLTSVAFTHILLLFYTNYILIKHFQ